VRRIDHFTIGSVFDFAGTPIHPTPVTLSAAEASEFCLRVYTKHAGRCVTTHGLSECAHDQRVSEPKEERHQRLSVPKQAPSDLSRSGYGADQKGLRCPFKPLLTRVVVRTLALYLTFRPLPTRMAFRIRSGLNGHHAVLRPGPSEFASGRKHATRGVAPTAKMGT